MPFGRPHIYPNDRYFFGKRNDAERRNYKMECAPDKIVFYRMAEREIIGSE